MTPWPFFLQVRLSNFQSCVRTENVRSNYQLGQLVARLSLLEESSLKCAFEYFQSVNTTLLANCHYFEFESTSTVFCEWRSRMQEPPLYYNIDDIHT